MTFWGSLKDGSQLLLGEPEQAALTFDREAPADLLEAVFPADRVWEELVWVTAYQQGEPVFRGLVDEQNTRLTDRGITVELVCRSGEALLLDNEAPPVAIRRPSLEKLWKTLLEPLGIPQVVGEAAAPGELTVEKGSSCWAVVSDFCTALLGTRPYVDCQGILHCEGVPRRELELEEVLSAELGLSPCKRLSAVWQQSFRGSYDTPYRDREAPVERRRYVSMQSGANPKELLAQGRQESFSLTVECPGLFWPLRGAVATVEVPGLGAFSRCPVRSGRALWDETGQRTKLVLERGEEPCG